MALTLTHTHTSISQGTTYVSSSVVQDQVRKPHYVSQIQVCKQQHFFFDKIKAGPPDLDQVINDLGDLKSDIPRSTTKTNLEQLDSRPRSRGVCIKQDCFFGGTSCKQTLQFCFQEREKEHKTWQLQKSIWKVVLAVLVVDCSFMSEKAINQTVFRIPSSVTWLTIKKCYYHFVMDSWWTYNCEKTLHKHIPTMYVVPNKILIRQLEWLAGWLVGLSRWRRNAFFSWLLAVGLEGLP